VAGLAGLVALLGSAVVPVSAALLPPLFQPSPAIPPVAAPISADPAGEARGTMILVHGGAWAGHSALGQQLVMDEPGALLVARGWRVVSVDYEEGAAGLQGVLDVVGAELARNAAGPLCLYGESAGAHLALVAASRLPAIRCVIGIATPTDFVRFEAEGDASGDPDVRIAASRIERFFGTTADELAPWNLVTLAPALQADVLLLHESDDPLVPAVDAEHFQAALPTTQLVELEAGDPADPSTKFRHGTISQAGRAVYAAAIGSFADRALVVHEAERLAAGLGCAHADDFVTRVGVPALRRALRCLALEDLPSLREATGDWRRTTIRLRGNLDAALIWAQLRTTVSGRRALIALAARRATVALRIDERSRVIVRRLATPRG
jgi:dienelactone hydrolase